MTISFFDQRPTAPAASLPVEPERVSAPPTENAWAVASFVLSSIGLAPLAIVCAHRALNEIKVYGGGGRRTAITSLVVSYLLVLVAASLFGLFLFQLPHLIASLSGVIKSLAGIVSTLNPSSAHGAPPAGDVSSLLGKLGGLAPTAP
jgi:type IV secretory pathway TrbD component